MHSCFRATPKAGAIQPYRLLAMRSAPMRSSVRLRLHVRHIAASHAVMSGENLPLVGKLLGHRRHPTTAGNAHVVNEHLVEAAEKVGVFIAQAMSGTHSFSPKKTPTNPYSPVPVSVWPPRVPATASGLDVVSPFSENSPPQFPSEVSGTFVKSSCTFSSPSKLPSSSILALLRTI